METKNKFDTFDELDDFDKMLFEYYKNKDTDIPLSAQNAINTAFDNKSKSKSTTFVMFKKVAIFILALGIITTTTVYAKDIVNFIINVFINSNRGIDKAVDNGYVQNVDMDYIVCNDVGVKVDYLLMDDKNLDISFVYKNCKEIQSLNSLTFSNLIITNEKNNVLCLMSNDKLNLANEILDSSITTSNTPVFTTNNTVRESILVSAQKFPSSTILYINIKQMALTINNEVTYIDGDWKFSINIEDNVVNPNVIKYSSIDYAYIDNIIAELTATSLSIQLQLNTLFDESTIYTRDAIILRDEYNTTYRPTQMLSNNNYSIPYSSNITLLYPISSYDNINKLYLHIDLTSDKQIDIELYK